MHTRLNNAGTTKSRSVANRLPHAQSKGEPATPFLDKRPQAIVQRNLQELANNSPLAMPLSAFQDRANNDAQAKKVTQLQANANGPAIQPVPEQRTSWPPEAQQVAPQEQGQLKPNGYVKSEGTIQRISAAGIAPLAGNYAPGPLVNLYNTPPDLNLPQGVKYQRILPAVPDAQTAINSYINETGPLGAVFVQRTFLDRQGQPPNLPGPANFNNPASNFHIQFGAWAGMAPAAVHGLGHAAAGVLQHNLQRAHRAGAMNNPNIGLVDPFVAELTIPQIGAGNWVFETNWSHNALSYITRVTHGGRNITGRIHDQGNWANVSGLRPYAHDFLYGSGHDLGTAQDVGQQIAGIQNPARLWGGPTNQDNHPGLDAITKLAAEGARFTPVRNLGMRLKVNSRFYTVAADGTVRALTFLQLYANWGAWFQRQYQRTAAQVRVAVLAHGAPVAGGVDLNHDYDLDHDAPASTRIGLINGQITALLNLIDPLQQEYDHIQGTLRPDGKNNAARLAAMGRVKDQMAPHRHNLRQLERPYPGLVNAIRAARAAPAGGAQAPAGWWQRMAGMFF